MLACSHWQYLLYAIFFDQLPNPDRIRVSQLYRYPNEIVDSQLEHIGIDDALFDVCFGTADENFVLSNHQAQLVAAFVGG